MVDELDMVCVCAAVAEAEEVAVDVDVAAVIVVVVAVAAVVVDGVVDWPANEFVEFAIGAELEPFWIIPDYNKFWKDTNTHTKQIDEMKDAENDIFMKKSRKRVTSHN